MIGHKVAIGPLKEIWLDAPLDGCGPRAPWLVDSVAVRETNSRKSAIYLTNGSCISPVIGSPIPATSRQLKSPQT